MTTVPQRMCLVCSGAHEPSKEIQGAYNLHVCKCHANPYSLLTTFLVLNVLIYFVL